MNVVRDLLLGAITIERVEGKEEARNFVSSFTRYYVFTFIVVSLLVAAGFFR